MIDIRNFHVGEKCKKNNCDCYLFDNYKVDINNDKQYIPPICDNCDCYLLQPIDDSPEGFKEIIIGILEILLWIPCLIIGIPCLIIGNITGGLEDHCSCTSYKDKNGKWRYKDTKK